MCSPGHKGHDDLTSSPPSSVLSTAVSLECSCVATNINHIIHRLCGPPSIPLSFNLAIVLPRCNTYCVNCGTQGVSPRTPSIDRLQRGLPGYLILFAPHAFAPHRQLSSSNPPSPLVFFLISTHFTATLGIPVTSPILKGNSFKCSSRVEPADFTSDLSLRLHALYTQ